MSIRIVLARVSHPGNIGAAARAMKTMGLDQLCLVAPERYPAAESTVMAAGADDVLAQAKVFADVRSAVADCGLVIGTTARSRHFPWRMLEPRDAAVEIARAAGHSEVAVLFGAERTGLTNKELELCQLLLTIPVGSSYGSLNIAMAVQIVAYEILLATRGSSTEAVRGGIGLASASEMERFYEHLERVLEEIAFRDRTGEGHLMARLRRFFNRAVPDQNEINILRGILTAVQGRRRRAGEPHTPRGAAGTSQQAPTRRSST